MNYVPKILCIRSRCRFFSSCPSASLYTWQRDRTKIDWHRFLRGLPLFLAHSWNCRWGFQQANASQMTGLYYREGQVLCFASGINCLYAKLHLQKGNPALPWPVCFRSLTNGVTSLWRVAGPYWKLHSFRALNLFFLPLLSTEGYCGRIVGLCSDTWFFWGVGGWVGRGGSCFLCSRSGWQLDMFFRQRIYFSCHLWLRQRGP